MALGAYAVASPRGCGHRLVLDVAVAPGLAPAVRDVATDFDRQRHEVDGRCVRAVVRAADPSGTAMVLSGTGSVPGDTTPDVWIPDSSFWLTLARGSVGDRIALDGTPVSMARTPVVAATTRPFATRLGGDGVKPTWETLLRASAEPAGTATAETGGMTGVDLRILDPAAQAAGMAALVMMQTLLRNTPDAASAFTQLVQNVRNTVSPTPESLLAALGRGTKGKAPVLIVPEQSLWAYGHAAPAVEAEAFYPSEGEISLDYPFVPTAGDVAKRRAARLLEQAMGTARARAAVQALGFRDPGGHAGDGFTEVGGLSPRIPRTFPRSPAAAVTGVIAQWNKLSLGTRVLALVDVSGSMLRPVAKGVSRMQATVQIGQHALATLPDDTEVGLWTFATHLDGKRDYRVQVPIGPLSTRTGSVTRRQSISFALNAVRPRPDGGTGLYDSVLAAVRSLRSTYRPGYYNNVLLLTDGRNDDHGISLTEMLDTLRREDDPARPVPVISIGFGPGVDMATLQKIAAPTDGAAYHALTPQDVQRTLLKIIAERIKK
ncbi:substrate-binding domain-containing protein [Actinomadura sp. DC4]|uniref:substrate-binding domain-containing protein n=1 Tax=Actinomadura sp. DC4 TaxID=3055069 RepID=UPI0025B1F7FA|nr:substrate-binding domain-containing protein [Actinomadura sp. DC4]MDN3357303.1 substrate-binding domain-containing protein [Actinomadura sp. DC4]